VIVYDKELYPEQLRVVNGRRRPALVIADSGSGKTRTLTYRVARLMESGVPHGTDFSLHIYEQGRPVDAYARGGR